MIGRKGMLALAGLAAMLAAPASAQTVLRFSNWVPPAHPIVDGIYKAWADQVAQATAGRVKIEIVSPLGAPPAHFDLVKNGVADLAMPVPSYTATRFQLTRLFELPFLSDYSTPPSIASWRTHEKFFQKGGEWDGVKLLSHWVHGPAHLYTIAKPVRTIEDMKGLKVRVAGGMSQEVTEAIGGTSFFAAASQVYEMLSKGVGDAVVFPPESVPSFKLTNIVKYGTTFEGGLYRTVHALIMNERKWNALSAEDRAAIEKVSGESLAKLSGAVWDRIDAEGTKMMADAGMQTIKADAAFMAAVKERTASIESKWLEEASKKGVDAKAAIAFFREEMKRLAASN